MKKAPQYIAVCCHHNQLQQQDVSLLGLHLLYGCLSLRTVAIAKEIADKLNIESELRKARRRKRAKGEKEN